MAKSTPCPTCGADLDAVRALARIYAMHPSWNAVCEALDPRLHDYDATTQYLIQHGFTHSRRSPVPGTWLLVTPTGGTSVRIPQADDAEWTEKMASLIFVLALHDDQGELGVLTEIARHGVLHAAR